MNQQQEDFVMTRYCNFCGTMLENDVPCNCEGAVNERHILGENPLQSQTHQQNASQSETVQKLSRLGKNILAAYLGIFKSPFNIIKNFTYSADLITSIVLLAIPALITGLTTLTIVKNIIDEKGKVFFGVFAAYMAYLVILGLAIFIFGKLFHSQLDFKKSLSIVSSGSIMGGWAAVAALLLILILGIDNKVAWALILTIDFGAIVFHIIMTAFSLHDINTNINKAIWITVTANTLTFIAYLTIVSNMVKNEIESILYNIMLF